MHRHGDGMTYLGCEVEPQIAVLLEGVLDKEWNLVGEAKLDCSRQAARLAEVDEIFERKSKRDGFGKIDCNIVLRLVNICMASQVYGA